MLPFSLTTFLYQASSFNFLKWSKSVAVLNLACRLKTYFVKCCVDYIKEQSVILWLYNMKWEKTEKIISYVKMESDFWDSFQPFG